MKEGISQHYLAGRQFLNFFDAVVLPVDRIKKFDFNVANGGASGHSVQIVTDDPHEQIVFAFENCDAVRAYIQSMQVGESIGV